MRSIRLTIARQELVRALATLGVVRRRRFSSSLPVWLRFVPEEGELEIVEDRGSVTARVPAEGTWPSAGATIDLFLLRRAAAKCPGDLVDLHAIDDAVILYAGPWHVRLNLLKFGPESRIPPPPRPPPGPENLPLFRWAARRS